MAGIKLGVIGGGNPVVALGLIQDLCVRPSLAGSEVVLMDTDLVRPELMRQFGARYAAEVGADVKFFATAQRQEALEDAQVVVNAAQSPGRAAVERARSFMEDGGYYRRLALYQCLQVRLMVSIAREVQRVCPKAWLIQASDPLPEACTAMTRVTPVKVVGLCRGHNGYREIARVLGLDPAKVAARIAGLNHCTFLTRFEHEGKDAYPLIDRWIESQSEACWRDWQPKHSDAQLSPAAVEQYRMWGRFPVGETARAGGWWFHTDLETKKRWFKGGGGIDSEPGWKGFLKDTDERISRIVEAARNPAAKLAELFPPQETGEQFIPLVDALVNDSRAEVQVNVPNRGAIQDIADDVVVEVPTKCSRNRIEPAKGERLPELLMLNVIGPRILRMERLVSLSLRPDRRMLMHIILDDRRTRSWDEAAAYCRELLALNEFAEMAAEMERNSSPATTQRGG